MKGRRSERGNALIYILIAIALFAALGFTLSRSMQGANTDELDEARAEFYATQMMAHVREAQGVIDQMMIMGSDVDDLDFVQPGETGFDIPPHIHKVFHPDGGGLTPMVMPEDVKNEISYTPPAGWYLEYFNNVGWTPTGAHDVIYSAYQIAKPLCHVINKRITGSEDIPKLSNYISALFIDTSVNMELTSARCTGCNGHYSLCVQNNFETAYIFYNIVLAR